MSSDPLDSRPFSPFVWLPVWLSVLIHAGAWMSLGYWLVFRVPLYKEFLVNTGVELPSATILLIGLSDLLVSHWSVPLMSLVIVLGGDVLMDCWLARHEQYQLRLIWFLIWLGIPAGAMIFSIDHLDSIFLNSLWQLS